MSNVLFQIGLSGLRAHKRRLEVGAHNLANVNTPGYSRQVVDLQSVAVKGLHVPSPEQGVDSGTPRRQIDGAITRSLRGLGERHGYSQARLRIMEEAEGILGDPDTGPLGVAVDSFFSAASDLSTDAASLPRRRAFLDAADRLASSIRHAESETRRIRDEGDVRLRANVEEVNRLTSRIAAMNPEIVSGERGGAELADLRDERDRAIQQLSALVDVRVVQGDRGMITVQTADGHQLVGGLRNSPLGVEADPSNGGHLRVRALGAPGQPLVDPLRIGGAIGGTLAARDGMLISQSAALDDLAFDLATQMNAALAGGTDLDGNVGQALFDAGGTRAGAASLIALHANIVDQPRRLAISASGAAGDNANAVAILGLETQGIIGAQSLTPANSVSSAIFDLASAVRTARDEGESNQVLFEEGEALRESLLGVSPDEELVAITEAQRAFQAAAKVITAADELSQEILALKR